MLKPTRLILRRFWVSLDGDDNTRNPAMDCLVRSCPSTSRCVWRRLLFPTQSRKEGKLAIQAGLSPQMTMTTKFTTSRCSSCFYKTLRFGCKNKTKMVGTVICPNYSAGVASVRCAPQEKASCQRIAPSLPHSNFPRNCFT